MVALYLGAYLAHPEGKDPTPQPAGTLLEAGTISAKPLVKNRR